MNVRQMYAFINMWKNGINSFSINTEIIFEVFSYSEYSKFSFSSNVNRAIIHRCIFYFIKKMKMRHLLFIRHWPTNWENVSQNYPFLSIYLSLLTSLAQKLWERFTRLPTPTFAETSRQLLFISPSCKYCVKAFQENFLYHWFCKHVTLSWDKIPTNCEWPAVLVLASDVSVLIILCC